MGSLRFAVLIVSQLTLAMIAGTLIESRADGETARRLVYHALWFDMLLSLLAVNLAVSVLNRIPLRLKHLGFAITHLGIIMILAASLVTHQFGMDAQLALTEGETADRVAGEPLGFSMTLETFNVTHYPGTASPASFASRVRIEDGLNVTSLSDVISMNRPLDYGGFRFFQSEYVDATPPVSILSVSRDPGGFWVYAGAILMVIGMMVHLVLDGMGLIDVAGPAAAPAGDPGQRRKSPSGAGSKISSAVSAALLFAMICAAPAAAKGVGAEEILEPIPVQHEGRIKPLRTAARQIVRRITGQTNYDGMPPSTLMLSIMADPQEWAQEPLFKLTHPELKAFAGLAGDQSRISYRELFRRAEVRVAVESAVMKSRGPERLTPRDRAALDLYSAVEQFDQLAELRLPALIPPPDGGAWLGVGSAAVSLNPDAVRVQELFLAMLASIRREDVLQSAVDAASVADAIRSVQGGRVDARAAESVRWELLHDRLHPFRLGWMLYAAGAVLLMIAAQSSKRRATWAVAIVVAGFACHTAGLVLRALIAGRAPVSNMYESLIFLAWGVLLFAFAYSLKYQSRLVLILASVLGAAGLLLADAMPAGPEITPLPPVLLNTVWLTVHVMTIVLSYSAFALAAGAAHVLLYRMARLSGSDPQPLEKLHLKILFMGVFLLAAGIFFGAVWANESWGRYWGWDPKETWALITLLIYITLVHACWKQRLATRAAAACSILAFMSVVMTYYGVNFILAAGLHSYGFGSGGVLPALAYLAAELGFIGWALRLNPAPVAAHTGGGRR